ncbi:arylesterase [Rhizobiaceae bacterium n13]|uniref:arylesterase n=1 Tax=Ferirhizobium litorale TaxID=2927786 RepID=UPI0024B2D759|nr:arylesterase [Fererhizobium litorale]MDI7862426.1 arylesterase [Fererhizobium litorale]
MRLKALAIQFGVILASMIFAFGEPAVARTLQIVGFGDSLMAGYELPEGDAYPMRLQAALKVAGLDVAIANAGVSGDTTESGLARLDWSIPDGTDGVILELGANDALRGIAPASTERNLDAIIARLKERGIAVMLAGMLAPPNMGDDYAAGFNPIYQRLADKHGLKLYPFFLDGVVTQPSLQLEDGMHPNAAGVAVMVERSLPAVESFLRSIPEN